MNEKYVVAIGKYAAETPVPNAEIPVLPAEFFGSPD